MSHINYQCNECNSLEKKLDVLYRRARWHLDLMCKYIHLDKCKDCVHCVDYNNDIVNTQKELKQHKEEKHPTKTKL